MRLHGEPTLFEELNVFSHLPESIVERDICLSNLNPLISGELSCAY